MLLDLVTLGDPRLSQKSEKIDKIDSAIKTLVKDMFETLHYENGFGLSAVQIGVMKRLFVTDVPQIGGKLVVINPVIKDLSENKSIYDEGCLSVPGISSNVERPESVVIEFLDINGKQKRIKASGLLATCIQHEYDHLEGILFIDRLDPESKLKKIKEYRDLQKR